LKKLLFIAIILSLGIILLKYGRSIYVPLVKKVKGKETVESVLAKIEHKVHRRLQKHLEDVGFSDYPKKIIFVAFKEERVFQVYSNDSDGIKFIKEYPFTAFSGKLGPKLKEGDRQIPEGIYDIEYFNPNSAFYLSLKVSYPNEFDKSKSKFSEVNEMGGDIFIHGKAATVGCIPLGDEAIEEVFVLAQKAKGNRIPVIISPRNFRSNNVFPKINSVDWEQELYGKIKMELDKLPQLKD